MNEREKYNKYNEMRTTATCLEDMVRAELENRVPKVYCVYITVGDEEKDLYFVDIEIGGDEKSYHHYKGMFTKDAIERRFL